MERYWLYLEPYTFLSAESGQILLYNSLSGDKKSFERHGKAGALLERLMLLRNMYCIEITEEDIKDKQTCELVEFIRVSYSGDILQKQHFTHKPTLFPPVLNLQYDVEKMKGKDYRSVGEGIKSYLFQIDIYIGGQASGSALSRSSDVYKQFEYTKAPAGGDIDFEALVKFIPQIEGTGLRKIKVLGGNIFSYESFSPLVDFLNHITVAKSYCSHYADIPDPKDGYSVLNGEDNYLEILVDFPLQSEKWDSSVRSIKDSDIKTNWVFAVCSEEEFSQAAEIVDRFGLEKAEIKPVFTGENRSLFENNVYLTKEDLNHVSPGKNDIFARQKMNMMDFGKLTIVENGDIYANVNNSKLGNIVDSRLIDILVAELESGESWRWIRDMEPCNNCIYQWLCPSPSNYEIALNQYNLCNIK